MSEGRIRCACGSSHATVAEVRTCRGIEQAGISPGPEPVVAPPSQPTPPTREPEVSTGTQGAAAGRTGPSEEEDVDVLKCPYCANAWGALKPGTTMARCQDCLSYWDTAAPRPVAENSTVYSTQSEESVYHATRFCEWLARGQERAQEHGWEPTAVTSLSRMRTRSLGKAPCRACTPREWRS